MTEEEQALLTAYFLGIISEKNNPIDLKFLSLAIADLPVQKVVKGMKKAMKTHLDKTVKLSNKLDIYLETQHIQNPNNAINN